MTRGRYPTPQKVVRPYGRVPADRTAELRVHRTTPWSATRPVAFLDLKPRGWAAPVVAIANRYTGRVPPFRTPTSQAILRITRVALAGLAFVLVTVAFAQPKPPEPTPEEKAARELVTARVGAKVFAFVGECVLVSGA